MTKILAIGWFNTLRFVREKSNLFFVFVLPLLIIMLLGVSFGSGFDATIGIDMEGNRGDPLVEDLIERIEALDGVDTARYDDWASLVDGVQRGEVDGGLDLPPAYSEVINRGEVVELSFVTRPEQAAALLRQAVEGAIADQAAPIRVARFVAAEGAGTYAEALPTARLAVPAAERVTVTFREAGEPLFEGFENLGQFDLGASSQLVLFMFLTSLAGSADLIQTRRLGVATRMLSTPTSTPTILGGETLGRYGVALVQGLYIMVGTLLLFSVEWGDPLGAIAIVLVFALVGTGGAMLMGSIFSNDQQAGGLGVLLGLGLAALGGAMVPIELFPSTMETVAKFTPHAWAIDAYSELVRRDGTLVDILPQLGMLLVFAAVFLSLATWRLHRVLTR
jgi:ABC-2 type transport system permease protein